MAQEIAILIGAVLGDWYSHVKEAIGEEPPEWLNTAISAVETTFLWASQIAERHENLRNSLSFMFLFFSTSRKLFLGVAGLIWAVFSFLLGSVWAAFSFLVGSLWAGISFLVMSVWAVLAFLLGWIWAALSFLVGSIWVVLSFLVGSIWGGLCFIGGSIWMALCYIVGSVWVVLCFVAGLIWAVLPFVVVFVVVSGLAVWGGFLILREYYPGIDLFLMALSKNPNPKGPLIRVDVFDGHASHEVIVPAYSTFGHVRKRLAEKIGREPVRLRLFYFRGLMMRDEEHLHITGVMDESLLFFYAART